MYSQMYRPNPFDVLKKTPIRRYSLPIPESSLECDGAFSTALQAACFTSKVANVKYLLDNGADPNILGGWYGNALQIAVAFRRREIAKLLLERGADINAKGGLYGSAFEAANGDEDMTRLLTDFGTNQE